MHDPTSVPPTADPRVRLAAERTLLAWIRTGLAMMGFGFVVARFALWLRLLAVTTPATATTHHHLSVWFGTTLVLLGVVTNVVAAARHRRYVRALDGGDPYPTLRPTLPLTIAGVLAAVGLAMAAYLLVDAS